MDTTRGLADRDSQVVPTRPDMKTRAYIALAAALVGLALALSDFLGLLSFVLAVLAHALGWATRTAAPTGNGARTAATIAIVISGIAILVAPNI
ncbi:hypothetical protein [Nocardioides aequoreus]|uniref:hypothetical protein n=1 Tax=Nocardioides aequoreus TaxID=397278 RepID=UPI0004C40521|nr:hypothetical protein [Nocardioides aequoreus]